MGRNRKPLPLIEKVTVSGAAAEGKAIARHDNKVIFITNAVPGDIVDVQVLKKRKSYMEGKAVHFHTYSPKRAEPFCSHFGTCGGCKWQFLKYEDQLIYKQQQVDDNLKRIGHLEFPEIRPILAAPATTYYRNKLEFTFSNKRWLSEKEINSGDEINGRDALGFHIRGMFDKILDIDHCYLQKDPSNAIRLAIREYAIKEGYTFFDLRNQEGLLRNLIIRTASTGELMVIVSFFYEDEEKRIQLLDHLRKTFPEITSLMYVINDKKNDSMDGLSPLLFSGRDHILEEMEGLSYRIGPKSFYQTNSEQAFELYKTARNLAGIGPQDIVYDLYTGTGTIALFVARQAGKVIGMEYVEEAIEDAKTNAERNKIDNTTFYAGDIKDLLTDELVEKHGRPNVIITDPPRAGMHADVVNKIAKLAPERIVYVSCNPATQARDVALLKDLYTIEAIQPVDMFPHTHHVENVILLALKT